MGLEKRLNEMAKENFYKTHTAVSQPIVPQPIVPRAIVPIENENGSKPAKTPDSVEVANNFWEEQCVPLYKELQAQDNGVRSHAADIIRGHAQDLPKEESGEQVKRLQKLLQQQIMSLEAVKKREEQATAELKAKNEELQSQVQAAKNREEQATAKNKELQSQVCTLEKQLERAPNQPTSTTKQSQEGEFWEVPRADVTLNMQEYLGHGAWGYVVKGLYQAQEVAVKCLHGLITDQESVSIIRREISIMAQIRHPNIVQLIAAVIDDQGDPLIVTELLDTTLRKSYESNLLNQHGKLCIFRDVAAALNYLHSHHHGCIIHRDVSSSNVLLEEKRRNQWKAKLSDFGSAKLAREAKTIGPGAPVYTAPEICMDKALPQTPKVDVYSYGIVVCEVAVNQFPSVEKFPKMLQEVSRKWGETMPSLQGLIISCTEENPDSRPIMCDILQNFNTVVKNTTP